MMTMAPMDRKLPSPEKSRLVVEAMPAMAKNTAAVPRAAIMTSWVPLLKQHALQQRSEQQAQKKRETQKQADTERTVLVALDGVDPAIEHGQYGHKGQNRTGAHEAQVDVRPD